MTALSEEQYGRAPETALGLWWQMRLQQPHWAASSPVAPGKEAPRTPAVAVAAVGLVAAPPPQVAAGGGGAVIVAAPPPGSGAAPPPAGSTAALALPAEEPSPVAALLAPGGGVELMAVSGDLGLISAAPTASSSGTRGAAPPPAGATEPDYGAAAAAADVEARVPWGGNRTSRVTGSLSVAAGLAH